MSNSYCTIAQMINLADVRTLNAICSDTGVQGNVSDSSDAAAIKLQQCLDIAASEVDSYLYGRVAIPPVPVPPLLIRLVVAKTWELLYGRRNDMPEKLKAEADWASDWLDKFRLRKVSIPSVAFAQTPVLSRSLTLDGTSQFDDLPFFNNVPEQDNP